MKEEIKKWFAGDKDYQHGIELLEQGTSNRVLVNSLRKKQSTAHQAKLEYELNKYLGQEERVKKEAPARKVKPIGETAQKKAPVKKEPEAKEPADREKDYPPDLTELMVELRKLHNERGKLSNSLREFDVKDNKGRKKVVDRMDEINERMKEIKDIRAEFEKSGKMPAAGEEKKIPDNTFELLKHLQNLKSNRSKWTTKKKKARHGSAVWVKAENKLNELQKEINEIEGVVNIRKSQAKQA